ncbi:hypothetical protein B0H66DRAFT_627549 [Apodospora peruviana]|uniref:Uncharacterized protein n=1 Tax=Apodospora peruviana TaxID=516989 RepID=A0AAE0HXQ7_9PEZI|nr:hypothetical protein B0H66DRAFT_627549 [Apodospora peruviana]
MQSTSGTRHARDDQAGTTSCRPQEDIWVQDYPYAFARALPYSRGSRCPLPPNFSHRHRIGTLSNFRPHGSTHVRSDGRHAGGRRYFPPSFPIPSHYIQHRPCTPHASAGSEIPSSATIHWRVCERWTGEVSGDRQDARHAPTLAWSLRTWRRTSPWTRLRTSSARGCRPFWATLSRRGISPLRSNGLDLTDTTPTPANAQQQKHSKDAQQHSGKPSTPKIPTYFLTAIIVPGVPLALRWPSEPEISLDL